MKRFYLLMLILFSIVALPAQAQFSWGIKGGANISSLHFSDLPETFSKSNITGFHIGPTIELIAPVVGLGFDASILYSQTGVEMGRQKIKNDYLDIPVNLKCAEADGISEEIRDFVVPLCANIHMAGSMITITACSTAVCLMYDIPIGLGTVIPFICTLGIAMVASPGAPGGSIMTALPFLWMMFGRDLGDVNGPLCAVMVALYITQDSFGTACNVSGDNAIGVMVDAVAKRLRAKKTQAASPAEN